MILHANQSRELDITTTGKRIIVKTKTDIKNENIRKEQFEFIKNSLIILCLGIALGLCITIY